LATTGSKTIMIPETFNNKPIQKIIGLSNFKIRKTGKTAASIFLFNEEPAIDVKQNKEDIIQRLNKEGREHEIDTPFAKVDMQLKRKLKIDNPFRKSKHISKLDDTHYKEYINNRNIRRHRSKFKRLKLIRNS